MYTIRQCIEEMKKVGTNVVLLNNGTKIVIPEISARPEEEPFSRFKGRNRVMRRILCRIDPSNKTKMVEELKANKHWWLYDEKEAEECYSFFGPMEFMLPERVMNEFISANGGIDRYMTVTAYAYMLSDMRAAAEW